jgi:malonate transporter and related proteins
MLNLILQGIVPVVVILALGYFAGLKGMIDTEGARSFSTYVVKIGLPSTLFVGIFNFAPAQLENFPYLATMVLTIMVPFGAAVVIGKWSFKQPLNEAGLFACNSGYPDMAYFGLPILTSVIGPQGLLPVIVGNVVASIMMTPAIVFFLHHGDAPASGVAPGRNQGSFVANMLETFKQPVVCMPILGLVLVLFKFHLPLLIRLPLQVIGNTTGGVALFTLGVLLSALKFQMNLATGIVIFLKNIAMPGIALGLGLLFHLDGILIKGAVIATACPSATLGAIFSATFKVGQKTIPTEVLASNLFGILSMVFWVYVVEKI